MNDWSDLARPDVRVVAPSPKVSGAGRWAFLAAWAYSLEKNPNDELKALQFVASIYRKNPVLNEGARGTLLSFLESKQGDVLLTWENEAYHALREHGEGRVGIIYPSVSIVAEPVVAVMDQSAKDRGTTETANAYLRSLFSPEGQEAAARHYLRPRDPEVAARRAGRFPEIKLLSLEEVFGSWDDAEKEHFSQGGTFDRIYRIERARRHSF